MIHLARHAVASPDSRAPGGAQALLTAAERARLAGFRIAKRRSDWLLGRVAAKCAVAAALAEVVHGPWPSDALEIASDARGRPYARIAPAATPPRAFAPGEPLPISVSISHTEGQALAAATWSAAGEDGSRRELGVDLGRVEPRSREFLSTFLTEAEQRFVRDAPPFERALRANLVWCGKEAALKALGLGLTVDTLELCCLPDGLLADPVEWPLSPADEAWRPFVAICSPSLVPGGGALRGVWRSFPGFVAALASHAATPARRGAASSRAHP